MRLPKKGSPTGTTGGQGNSGHRHRLSEACCNAGRDVPVSRAGQLKSFFRCGFAWSGNAARKNTL